MLQLPPLLWTLISALRVAGQGGCPTAAAVQQRLGAFVSDDPASARSASLRETAQGVSVSLLEADGTLVCERSIRSDRPCEERAEVAALLLASWLSQLQPQTASAVPLPDVAARLTERSGPWSWELVLAPTGSLAGATVAPGGLLQIDLGPAGGRWNVRALGLYDGPRQMAEGPGAVSWQRVAGGLGGGYALSRAPASLEIGGDAVLSDLLLNGSGFAGDGSSSSLVPGVDLGARLTLLRGRWHPWIGSWVTLWLRPEIPKVEGLTLQSALPQLAVQAGFGLAWQSAERF